jgi:transposase
MIGKKRIIFTPSCVKYNDLKSFYHEQRNENEIEGDKRNEKFTQDIIQVITSHMSKKNFPLNLFKEKYTHSIVKKKIKKKV